MFTTSQPWRRMNQFQRRMVLQNSVCRLFICKKLRFKIDDFSEAGNITAKIKAIFFNKSFHPSTTGVPDDTSFGLILDRTSFYAEAGGQEYDTGNIVIDGIADFEVTNVQVFNGYVLHIGRLKYGTLEVGNEVVSSF